MAIDLSGGLSNEMYSIFVSIYVSFINEHSNKIRERLQKWFDITESVYDTPLPTNSSILFPKLFSSVQPIYFHFQIFWHTY